MPMPLCHGLSLLVLHHVPACIFYFLLGLWRQIERYCSCSMGRDLADILSGRTSIPSSWMLAMTIATIALVAAAAAIMTHFTRRAIEKRLALRAEPLCAVEAGDEELACDAVAEVVLDDGKGGGVARSKQDVESQENLRKPLLATSQQG